MELEGGRDSEKISIALTIRSFDLLQGGLASDFRCVERRVFLWLAAFNPTYGLIIYLYFG
jgi:hypothetical protein